MFLSLYAAFVVPWLAAKALALVDGSAPPPRALVVTFAAGVTAWLVGAVLLAIPFLKRRLEPRWIGVMLLASALALLVGNLVLSPRGPSPNFVVNLASNLGPVLLMVALGYLGWRMRARRTARESPA